MKRSTSWILIALSALILTACGGGGGGDTTPPPVTLTSISLTPASPSVALNAVLHLMVTGHYSDGSTQAIYSPVSWSSSSNAVATVGSTTGLVMPQGTSGQAAIITATHSTLTATATVTLVPALTTFSISGASAPLVTDPLVAEQWGLRNTGQTGYADTSGVANTTGNLGTDINVDTVYSSYGNTGTGVIVAVVDSGLEIAHEDLAANVVANGSWDFANDDADPTSASTTGDHGTSVAGLIAMAKNGLGGIGVAPKAKLKGFNYLAPGTPASSLVLAAALGGSTASPKSNDVHVFNQSFGTGSAVDYPISTFEEAQYAYGVTTLRSGKGALYVKSAGNGFVDFTDGVNPPFCPGANTIGISCQNANFDPSNTLPYNIVMAALNANGVKSSYSTTGSAVWVSTPGGEHGYNAAVAPGIVSPATIYDPAMVTTDQSTCANGYSVTTSSDSTFNKAGVDNPNCNYANTMNGTSSAAPMMSGVIALMLEANPALTWREVKDILARTSVQVDSGFANVIVALSNGNYIAERAWTTNAAGFKFHNWYGFGAVNAKAAVDMARAYVSGSMKTFANTGWISSGTLAMVIPDDSTVGSSVALSVPKVGVSGKVETIQIKVTTSSASGWTGDLGIEVISPSGTRSILKNIRDGFVGNNLDGMVLASNAFYGENNTGTWTVKVLDGWSPYTQTLTNVQIRVYGH